MLNAGGQNSISRFASSYSRSANFINAEFDVVERPKHLEIIQPERTPLLDNPIADDNESIRSLVLKKIGSSTAPQTIFNGINTLIGIGLLSLPLAFNYSGWVFGSIILILCALSTQYTAKLLGKCLEKDESLKTYGDIAYFSFGKIAYTITIITFTIDLLSAGTSMIIIFSDSFNAIFNLNEFYFKLIISTLFFLSSFLDLSLLSHLSLIGIISTSLILLTVVFCGFYKSDYPGSLIDISPTAMWPENLVSLSLSIGILMSPFGGHAIFPELYKDMQHNYKYYKSVTTIFSLTLLVDYLMASIGYLMFGAKISDQITKSIMTEKGFPNWVKFMLVVLMGILPISKGPLVLRPLITLLDQFTLKKNSFIIKFLNRLFIVSIYFISSLIFTNFGKIMSFLGSSICFAICIIFPISFYLKIYFNELPLSSKVIYFFCIFISVLLATSGTIAVIIA